MKCIKLTDGKIKRCSDFDAENLVKFGKASYINKTQWKLHIYGLDDKTKKEPSTNVELPNDVVKKEEIKIKKAEKEAKKKVKAEKKQEKSHKK